MNDLLVRLDRREQIAWLEQSVLREPQVELSVSERLCDGMYLREMFIPKGTILTGKIHIREHVSIISRGDITIVTEQGTERYVAPQILISPPGTKRVGFAHEDTIWTTIHATPLRDLEKIPDSLTTMNYDEMETVCRLV
jgi:quercetin dioxygenase-like cupin family protein